MTALGGGGGGAWVSATVSPQPPLHRVLRGACLSGERKPSRQSGGAGAAIFTC